MTALRRIDPMVRLLIAAIALLRDLNEPGWMTPGLKQSFVLSYVLLAPLVGAFADSMPKGQVMLITNGIKIVGCVLMLVTLLSSTLVGLLPYLPLPTNPWYNTWIAPFASHSSIG